MKIEDYGPGDWSAQEIGAAQALWEYLNPHRPISSLHPSITDAWMTYLGHARVVLEAAAKEGRERR